jgi:hypothetical protein
MIILLGLTLVGFLAIGVFAWPQLACEGQPINNNEAPTQAQQIRGELIIGQSFLAPRDDLNRIDIMVQTYRRRNTHDVTLRLLEVLEGAGNPLEGLEVYQTAFNASTVRDQAWLTFRLPQISDSGGKRYLIALQSPESDDGNAITVGGIEQNVYLPGSAFLGPTPVLADITFRTCYQLTTFEKLQVLTGQLTRQRPGVWGHGLFYGVSLLVYSLLLIGFFWKLTKLKV